MGGLYVFFLAALAFSPLARPEVATEEVTVSVTLPVRVPLTVAPGETFEEAAKAFCTRNSISAAYVDDLTKALSNKWTAMQDENRAARCLQWQRKHAVVPLQTWGSLPTELRKRWLDMDCDALVPATAPIPRVSLPVRILDEVRMLDLYDGESVLSAVRDFCVSNSIDEAANGAKLRSALEALLDPNAQAKPKEEPADSPPSRGRFLFGVPVTVDGVQQSMQVHEGDDLGPLVSSFCSKHGIDENSYGELLRDQVLKTLKEKRLELLESAENDAARSESAQQERVLMFTLPVSLDADRIVNLEVYDGDLLSEAVSRFCEANGLDEEQHGGVLRSAAMERYHATKGARES